jgi:hypothetical protein
VDFFTTNFLIIHKFNILDKNKFIDYQELFLDPVFLEGLVSLLTFFSLGFRVLEGLLNVSRILSLPF